MSQTPHHISQRIDEILDRLNAKWDLQLPRLYGSDAQRAENDSSHKARRCSSLIRFLCYRPGVEIDRVIEDFEEGAKYIHSKWGFKPSQERGTLPSMPVTKSFIRRDMISRKDRPMSPALRDALVSKLSSVLDDEYQLARASDSYERTSSQSASGTTSRNVSFTTAVTELSGSPSLMRPPRKQDVSSRSSSASNKRRKTSGEAQEGKRIKPGLTSDANIKDWLKKSSETSVTESLQESFSTHHSHTKQAGREVVQDAVTSFETARAPSIFSNADEQKSVSSVNTSMISEEGVTSQAEISTQAELSTQGFNEAIAADPSFSFLLDSSRSVPAFSIGQLQIVSPFPHVEPLSSELQFWLKWEIYRLAPSISLLPGQLLRELEKDHKTASPRYQQFWSTIVRICKSQAKEIPTKSDSRFWNDGFDIYESAEGKTAAFSFKLEYTEKMSPQPSPPLWKLVLQPIKIDRGNRLHRKFGPYRHVVGYLNYFDKNSLPSWVQDLRGFNADNVFQDISRWLAVTEHHIAGLSWRAFFLEPEKSQSKQQREADGMRQKLHLFAIDNSPPDGRRRNLIGEFSLADLTQWHIPLKHNPASSDLKLFSRFGLALSKTRATVTLQPRQFRYLPHTKPVMNDGCAMMSLSLAQAIWQICGDGTTDIPSAFQGRTGGAKGLWILDYRSGNIHGGPDSYWIQISDSQLKIEPHPKDRFDADETQRTFEVLKYSKPCKPGHLNIQLINILAHGGVKRSTLRQVVLDDIHEYVEASQIAIKDARQLRGWIQKYHKFDRSDQLVSLENGPPEARVEELCMLVEGGLDAENCERVRAGIKFLMEQELSSYVEKLRIQVPHSTSVFCVPDPYEILGENEVYLGFSDRWENPITGLQETALDGIDVLVARNPAHLASDIQKRKAVYKRELRHFKDVIIFPTKGKVPLASLLSGGDYDGDTVTVIWDPVLVNEFRNTPKNEGDLPQEAACGLVQRSRKVTDFVKRHPASSEQIDEFFVSSISFNAQPTRLGSCTNEHEKLVYSGAKLSDRGPILLATLAGYLVDANKQGLFQPEANWHRICSQARGKRQLLELAYKSGRDHPRRGENRQCLNIMDFLKFDVAMRRKDEIFVGLNNEFTRMSNFTEGLAEPFNEVLAQSQNPKNPERKLIDHILKHLMAQLERVFQTWIADARPDKAQKRPFSSAVKRSRNMVYQIVPPKADCSIYRDFVREEPTIGPLRGSKKATRWSLLRAAAMYYRSKPGNRDLAWLTVGDELARIKARQLGITRELTPFIHNVLKANNKLIQKLSSGKEDDEFEDAVEE